MPVFNGYDHVVEALEAALRETSTDVPFCVINDASSDARIAQWVDQLGSSGRLEHDLYYIEHEQNLGFVAGCNEAFELVAPADVLLLNSDCVVAEGWLQQIRAVAASDPRIATVSALTNSGSVISVPERNTPVGKLAGGLSLEETARRVRDAAQGTAPQIPTAIGHCVLIKRSALDLVGNFDPIFSPGYGEEVDFSLRCVAAGLKNVVADDVFVLHHGGVSFSAASEALVEQHNEILFDRYPWFETSVSVATRGSAGPLDAALLRASTSLRKMRVTVDGSSLSGNFTGTRTHTLGVIAALAGSDAVELRVLVAEDLDDQVTAQLAGFGQVELLTTDEIDHDAIRADIVHRPFQISNIPDLRALGSLGHRVVISQLDQIAFHNPSYAFGPTEWVDYRESTIEALAMVDLALFISEHSAHDAIDNGLIDPARAKVIHIGVDELSGATPTEPIKPEPLLSVDEQPFLLCLGTNFTHKNRVFAIRLLDSLRKKGWSGRLVFAGKGASDGTSEQAERELLSSIGETANAVTDIGPVDEAGKLWLTEHCSAVLYPTTYEGFGLVPFEAAAAGAPCIFASHSSLAELLPDRLATIVPWNADESADNVLALLNDEALQEEHVEAIRSIASKLTWKRYGEQLIEAYEAVLQRPSAASTAVSLLGRGGGAVSREGFWLVGPDGLLDPKYERPLLAIANRPLLRVLILQPLRWLYLAGHRVRLFVRPSARERNRAARPAKHE